MADGGILAEGATSLAAANWSDATGFAANARLVINKGSQSIQTALDQSASGAINRLDVREGFSGIIGGTGGSMIFAPDADANNTFTAPSIDIPETRFRYWASGGQCWAQGSGANALNSLQVATGGTLNWTGGEVNRVELMAGTLNYSASALFGAAAVWYQGGGAGFVDTHASDVLPTIHLVGGSLRVRRTMTTLNVYGGSMVIDTDALAITTINIYGGTVTPVTVGAITNLNIYGGTLDWSRCTRVGAITNTLSMDGARVIPNPIVNYGTITPINGGADGM